MSSRRVSAHGRRAGRAGRVRAGALLAAVAGWGLEGMASDYHWRGEENGSWTNPALWMMDFGVPGVPDDPAESATIGQWGWANSVTLGAGDDIDVGSVQLWSPGADLVVNGSLRTSQPDGFRVSGGKLKVEGTLRVVSGLFELGAGTVEGTVRLSGENPTLNLTGGGSGGTYVFEDSGTLLEWWGSGAVRAGQTVVVRGDSTDTLASNTFGLVNAGRIKLTSAGGSGAAELSVGAGAVHNEVGGVIDVEAGSGGARRIVAARFGNDGTLNVHADTAISSPAEWPGGMHYNNGTVNVSPGVVLSTSSFVQSWGELNVAAGGQLRVVNGTFELSGGTVTGSVHLSGTNSILNFTSSEGRGGTYVFEDGGDLKSSWAGVGIGAGQTVVVRGGASDTVVKAWNGLENRGVITLSSVGGSGAAELAVTGGTFTNHASGVVNSDAGSGGGRTIDVGQMDNRGTFNVNADTTVSGWDGSTINNSGTVNVSAGVTLNTRWFRQTGGVLSTGPEGAVRVTSGTFWLSGGTVNGTVMLAGGSVLDLSSSAMGSGGTYVFEDSGKLDSGGGGGARAGQAVVVRGDHADTVVSAGGFNNGGVLTLESRGGTGASELSLGGRQLINAVGGVIDVNVGSGGARRITSGELLNFGTFNVNADATVTVSDWTWSQTAITSSGTVNVSAGVTLTASSFRQTAGVVNVGAGAAVRVVSGVFEHAGGTVAGTVRLSGMDPTLKLSSGGGGGGTFVFEDGGTLTAFAGVRAGETVVVRGDANDTVVSNTTGLYNVGVVRLTSAGGTGAAGLSLWSGQLVNAAGGVIRIEPGSGGARTINAGQLQNFGTLDVGADTVVTTRWMSNVAVVNLGTVNVSAGVTLSTPAFRQAGGVLNVGAGWVTTSSFEVTGGVVNGVVRLDGENPMLGVSAGVGSGGTYVFEGGGWIAGGAILAGQTVWVQGDASDATVRAVPGLQNSGVITLTSAGGSGAAGLSAEFGPLTNAPGGVINADEGSGGARRLTGRRVDNFGTINVNADTTVVPWKNGADVPLLMNSGVIRIAAGKTLSTPSYGVQGAGRLEMGAGAVLRVTAPMVISAGQAFAVGAGNTLAFGQVQNESGGVSVSGTAIADQVTGGGVVTVRGGGRLEVGQVAQSSLVLQGEVTNGASARVGPGTVDGGTTSRVSSLAISGASRLDLTNTNLVIDYVDGAASPLGAVRGWLRGGYAGGAWNGTGIATSAGLASRGLGYAEASALLGITGTQRAEWGGETVDASSVVVKFTVAGDADLDGAVGFADLVRLAQNYNVADGERAWLSGDFTYDGVVDFADLVVLAQNYNGVMPAAEWAGAPAGFAGEWAAAVAAVPEPGVGLVGAAGAVWAAGRRRRDRRGTPG